MKEYRSHRLFKYNYDKHQGHLETARRLTHYKDNQEKIDGSSVYKTDTPIVPLTGVIGVKFQVSSIKDDFYNSYVMINHFIRQGMVCHNRNQLRNIN